ncbi:c97ef680-843e-445f-af1d-3cf510720cea [Thermothielavioides terrestris]|uniref:C97ef680-843e-445f-af1d-3cf510720cea n=1 Tax=Thermothielavioides terrestris TaxID=2587410 RepID=A0A3S4B877_9PEZI|nr:c97ef680-843e-445f-af1d-3cf510720cea [Thermothielavioides terrestris]
MALPPFLIKYFPSSNHTSSLPCGAAKRETGSPAALKPDAQVIDILARSADLLELGRKSS